MSARALWTSDDIAAATSGQVQGTWAVTGISIDSRTLQAGDLFVALKGDNHNGHDHISAALSKGAAGVLISEGAAPGIPSVLVADTMQALTALASAARARAQGTLIAVTGSVGKTTTKEMLHHIASAQGSAYATYGNLNNHIGLPLTLARLPVDARTGVFEIGMNHADEIAPLSKLLRPHLSLITAIGTAHIENFSDGQTGIAKAKSEISAGLATGGTAILPRDSEFYPLLLSEARRYGAAATLSFGKHTEADAHLLSCVLHEQSTEVTAQIDGRSLTYLLGVPGEHMAMNSVASLMAASRVGLDLDAAARALLSFTPIKGRGVRKQAGTITIIDESYNASPLSMNAAIRVLAQHSGRGRRIVALGDMLELGDTAVQAHAELAAVLSEAQVDKVFCCGPLMQHLWQQVPADRRGAWAPDAKSLAPLVASALTAHDVLLVKGSRGQQVNINGVMSPSMAQIIAAVEAAQNPRKEASPHVA